MGTVKITLLFGVLSLIIACNLGKNVDNEKKRVADSIKLADSLAKQDSLIRVKKEYEDLISEYFPHTEIAYSKLKNKYIGFNSPVAINAIADIENEYFSNYHTGISKYYGSAWSGSAYFQPEDGEGTWEWDSYKKEMDSLNIKPEMFHCMVYTMKALKAGMGENYKKLQEYHRKIYKKTNYAGWSMAYILTTHFNWKAYLFLNPYSQEYTRCVKNFKKNKTYYVWNQPDINIEAMFILEKDSTEINKLLSQHEFGWGFSYQGVHNWITRFTVLKECMWDGAPCLRYNHNQNQYLFRATKFTDFKDYDSHVIVFPPKKL
ncbi:MAG: hypothetical protein B6I20_11045 [Bacteroidetes bacterium 4572_117]|nr:MAG: hypothetical protein B6I20_11045 [Bacteroidetes bacterium 4572_117]